MPTPAPAARRRGWGLSLATVFWSALGGVLSLAAYVGLSKLVEDLYARAPWLGWVGIGVTALLLIAAVLIVAREVAGLSRLARLDDIRDRAERCALTVAGAVR